MKNKITFIILSALILLSISQIAAQEWYKVYEDAIKDIENCRWQHAIKSLDKLVKKKNKPNANATTYSVYVTEYLPYFHLGRAYFFAEQYEESLKNFQLSEQYKAIKSTTKYPVFLSFKNAALKITDALSQKITELNKSKFEIDKRDTLLTNLLNLYHAEKYFEAANYLLKLSGTDKYVSEEIISQKDAIIVSQTLFQEQFNQALEAYLIGNYRSALKKFTQLLKQYPDNYLIVNWITKTKSELQLLQKKIPGEIGKDTVIVNKTITGAPVFSVGFLTSDILEVTSQKISISGTVGDDKGIQYIELTVNGTLFTNQNGDTVKLRPSLEQDPKLFPFKLEIPLQMGENQIALIAYDVDSVQHSEFLPFTVIRKSPVYKTPLFYIILISLIVLILAAIFISKIVKHRIAIVNKYNPYIAGAPILIDEMFFGREELLKNIMNTLHHNSLMIHGPRRIGKTSIQHKLKRRLETVNDPDFFYVPIYIDLQGVQEEKFFAVMMEDIVDGSKKYLEREDGLDFEFNNENEDSYNNRNFSRDLKKIISFLNTQDNKELRLVLLMDEVDELNTYSERINQRLRSIFMKTFAENLVAVMSGIKISKNWESEGSPWYNFFEEIEVAPLKREYAEQLIKTPVKGIFSYSDSAIVKILQYSENKPYIIQKFCIHSINRIIEERRRKVTAEDINTVRELVFEEYT